MCDFCKAGYLKVGAWHKIFIENMLVNVLCQDNLKVIEVGRTICKKCGANIIDDGECFYCETDPRNTDQP